MEARLLGELVIHDAKAARNKRGHTTNGTSAGTNAFQKSHYWRAIVGKKKKKRRIKQSRVGAARLLVCVVADARSH